MIDQASAVKSELLIVNTYKAILAVNDSADPICQPHLRHAIGAAGYTTNHTRSWIIDRMTEHVQAYENGTLGSLKSQAPMCYYFRGNVRTVREVDALGVFRYSHKPRDSNSERTLLEEQAAGILDDINPSLRTVWEAEGNVLIDVFDWFRDPEYGLETLIH